MSRRFFYGADNRNFETHLTQIVCLDSNYLEIKNARKSMMF